jgi:hemerythrin-like domain-containing protein
MPASIAGDIHQHEESTRMKPTEELIKEHHALLQMLDVLEQASGMLESGIDVDAHDLEKMLEFFRLFADGCHHAKEEQSLFPALEQAGIPRYHGPVGVMLAEHDLGRALIRGMIEALTGLDSKRQPGQSAATFSRNARAYAALLRSHIEKENHVLFPMADAALTPDRQAEVSRQFTMIERKKVGAESHEALHRLLEGLKATYLSSHAAVS